MTRKKVGMKVCGECARDFEEGNKGINFRYEWFCSAICLLNWLRGLLEEAKNHLKDILRLKVYEYSNSLDRMEKRILRKMVNCKNCKQPFPKNRPSQKFCSNKCRHKFWQKNAEATNPVGAAIDG